MIIETRECIKCGSFFTITKHQKTRKYCSDRCSKGWTLANGNKRGRPLDKDRK